MDLAHRRAIADRLAAITPGTWSHQERRLGNQSAQTFCITVPRDLEPGADVWYIAATYDSVMSRNAQDDEAVNATFIAHAPYDMRALIALVNQLERQIDAIQDAWAHYIESPTTDDLSALRAAILGNTMSARTPSPLLIGNLDL